jgi:hypothetical protein
MWTFYGRKMQKERFFIFEKSNFANITLLKAIFLNKDHLLLSLTPFQDVPPPLTIKMRKRCQFAPSIDKMSPI